MTAHSFIQYLRYKWLAMGRHGTHSPFVYDLVEHVLQDDGAIDRQYIIKYPTLPLHYENLLSRLSQYYGLKSVVILTINKEAKSAGNIDMAILGDADPAQWQQLLSDHYPLLTNCSMVVIVGIHTSEAHTTAWDALCKDERVKMSIDIYEIGLLLFRKEFKQPQHFILKY